VDGQAALLVLHMTFAPGDDRFDLYVNPAPGAVPATPNATKTDLDQALFNTVTLWSEKIASPFVGGVGIDEIRFGTTYQDVVPGSLQVPEPSSALLFGLAACGLFIVARRGRPG
jgi:hypothetical protein